MKRSRYMVGLVLAIFFVISFLTNIIGPIIPDLINSFHISLTAAGLLPFAFFIAYAVMSIPAGMLIEAYGEKRVISAAFIASMFGALAFAIFPAFPVAMTSFFLIGLAMAALQVAINPLLRVAGGEEHFAFNSTFAQLVFGSASFLSPQIYSYLVQNLSSRRNFVLSTLAGVVPEKWPWVSLYWIFAVVCFVTVLVIAASRFPKVELTEEERVGTLEVNLKLMRNRTVILFFISMFAYVGTEQGIAVWISKFLETYHHFDPQTTGANAVSWFWALMTGGCVIGMGLLKLFDSRKVLIGSGVLAIALLTVALFSPANISVLAFPAIGFGISVMYPIVMSLALNSVTEHHGAVAGILCSGISGGAVIPLIVGRIGDVIGLRGGMCFVYVTIAWILAIGFWARPIITNKTIGSETPQEQKA